MWIHQVPGELLKLKYCFLCFRIRGTMRTNSTNFPKFAATAAPCPRTRTARGTRRRESTGLRPTQPNNSTCYFSSTSRSARRRMACPSGLFWLCCPFTFSLAWCFSAEWRTGKSWTPSIFASWQSLRSDSATSYLARHCSIRMEIKRIFTAQLSISSVELSYSSWFLV